MAGSINSSHQVQRVQRLLNHEVPKARRELAETPSKWLMNNLCKPSEERVWFDLGDQQWYETVYVVTNPVGGFNTRIFVHVDEDLFGLAMRLDYGVLEYMGSVDTLAEAVNAI